MADPRHSPPSPEAGPGVPEGRPSTTMSPSDAVLWDIERDPVLRSTITAIGVLDRAPDWGRLVARLDRAVEDVPRLGQRVVGTPLGLGPPRWVDDPDFDLAYHLRRVEAPSPNDLSVLLAVAEPIAMAAFDRERPLWEFTLVEGLADGRAAIIQKVHHSLTDGVGGIELALALLDDRADVPLDPPPSPRHGRAPTVPGPLECLARSLVDQMGAAVRVAGGLPETALRLAPELPALVPSALRLLRPSASPSSPVLRGRGLGRRLGLLEVPIEDLRRAAKVVDGTVNDAFLAAVVGGLTRYHARHAVALETLRITMPISGRGEGDELLGNHFTPARFGLPADIEDPAERMRVVGAVARSWRDEPALEFTDVLATTLEMLPGPLTTVVMRGLLTSVDVVCSNVPGIPTRSWIAGAELLREFAFAPPGGSALSVTLLSHLDTACIGIACDTTAVEDPVVLGACLREGLAEVVGVGYRA
ncbi:MAG TPA: wax ester/triacylglycerol synthase domain-containing protein [Acidimicrobiales bacterium]